MARSESENLDNDMNTVVKELSQISIDASKKDRDERETLVKGIHKDLGRKENIEKLVEFEMKRNIKLRETNCSEINIFEASKYDLEVLFINLDLIENRYDYLESIVTNQYNLIGIVESKLSESENAEEIKLNDFKLGGINKTSSGTITLYVNQKFACQELVKSNQESIELYLFCRVTVNMHQEPMLVCVAYGYSKTPNFILNLYTLCLVYNRKIIMGNFNDDILEIQNNDRLSLRKFMRDLSLQLVPHGANYYTHTYNSEEEIYTYTHTWTDFILVDNKETDVACFHKKGANDVNFEKYHVPIGVSLKRKGARAKDINKEIEIIIEIFGKARNNHDE